MTEPQTRAQTRRRWVTPALLAAIVAILVGCFLLAPRTGPDGEHFAGTDATVTQMLADRGTKPWFQPLFEPGSAEVESGLFALQAALGAGVLGYALGNLRGRRLERARHERQKSVATGADTPGEA